MKQIDLIDIPHWINFIAEENISFGLLVYYGIYNLVRYLMTNHTYLTLE